MSELKIDIPLANIEQHFAELGRIGRLGPFLTDGFLRSAWSFEESEAMEYIRSAGASQGLQAHYDGIGNLYLTTPGLAAGVIQCGSHLDTVPKGGMYDGGAGIVAGLEAILALRPAWASLKHRLQLVVWRGEESATFGVVCKGSQAAFGKNEPGALLKKFEGKTMEEAIRSQGYDPEFIGDRRPTLTQADIDGILAHIELHIEQASKLERDEKELGIVSCIRGADRLRIKVTGEAAHAGGTPMGTIYRKDANLAMAYMQVELDRLVTSWLERGEDLVQTVGVINADLDYNLHDPQVYENAFTKVSPFGYFTLDVRSRRLATLNGYLQEARAVIQEVAERLRVKAEIITMNELRPTESLDEGLQALMVESCRELKMSYETLPSGALHDAAVVAGQKHSDGSPIPVGMIFIPCREGLSHNPKEYASPQAVRNGAKLLASVFAKLAGAG